MSFTYDPEGLAEYLHSQAWREALDDALDTATDYWNARARMRTGLMRAATTTEIVDGADGLEGVFTADPTLLGADVDYARFQEFGTRHIEGMRLLEEIAAVITDGGEWA